MMTKHPLPKFDAQRKSHESTLETIQAENRGYQRKLDGVAQRVEVSFADDSASFGAKRDIEALAHEDDVALIQRETADAQRRIAYSGEAPPAQPSDWEAQRARDVEIQKRNDEFMRLELARLGVASGEPKLVPAPRTKPPEVFRPADREEILRRHGLPEGFKF